MTHPTRFPNLLDFLMASRTPRENTTSFRQPEQGGTPPLPKSEPSNGSPWTDREIKMSLGINLDDPNVKVKTIPMPGLSGSAFDVERMFKELFGDGKVERAIEREPAQPHPVQAAGEEVTAPVTNAKPPKRHYSMNDIVEEVLDEVDSAMSQHAPMNSPHEGYAVIKEEVDELWEEVKMNCGRYGSAREEAIQIAAMAIRYLYDLQPQD